ncbi:MAG: TonB-dependent receptor [Bacteroidota bacterium]|nr:TonB-dependent receptor [Bacteroidota bacterium]
MASKKTVLGLLSRLFLIILILGNSTLLAQKGAASLKGKVIDATTGDALPGATIIVTGTALGAVSDIHGNYLIKELPAGNVHLKISYVSYKTLETQIQAASDKITILDFKLNPETILSKEVVVTAQAQGQAQAINQQLSSNTIVNVVSAARIQEVPDANAAESVGRLPGVSVLRSEGEGNKVVVRGLAPKYNNVLVAGVKMAATDPSDRSVDLSMISSYMLEGIEVTKAITPDMDANAIGGTVNFKLRQAPSGLKYDFLLQGGYNDLKNTYSDYKIVGNGSNRFFDDKLGVFAQIDIEKKNLNANAMGAGYILNSPVVNKVNQVYISSLNLDDIRRDRNRYGGTLVLDYQLPTGSIIFNNFISSGKTNSIDRGESYGVDLRTHTYDVTDAETKLNVMTNSIEYNQDLSLFNIKADLSHSYSEQQSPNSIYFDFLENSAFKDFSRTIAPNLLPKYALDNLNNTVLADISRYDKLNKDREFTGSTDINREFNLFDEITANFKIGGKYGYMERSYDYNSDGGFLNYGSGQGARDAILNAFPWMKSSIANGSLNMVYSVFVDHNYSSGTFLKGDYSMGPSASVDLMHQIVDVLKRYGDSEAYRHMDYSSTTNDYHGYEYHNAEYIMTDLHYSNLVQVIAGVRYENEKRRYTATSGNSNYGIAENKYVHGDTTTTVTNSNWLPMFHIKVRPTEWLDLRFAYTNTLSRPDFSTVIPRINIGTESVILNNYQLKPAHSENFDLYLSIHENTIGLFTAGVFKKNIKDLIFAANGKIIVNPAELGLDNDQKGHTLYTYLNNPNPVDLWGFEINWQTHFWYLPGLLSGLVLDANYTHIFSEADYPRTVVNNQFVNHAPWIIQTVIDTFYTARMISQPDNIANVALGWDYKGFSIRGSLIYQSNIFMATNFWPELRANTDDSWRWDLSVKQELPYEGAQVYVNLTNLSRATDRNINSGNGFPTSEGFYGLGANMGIRYRIK